MGNRDGTGKEKIRIVQVTDCHLFENPEAMLVGMNCEQSFQDVLSLIKRQQKDIACLICSGDIVQDASISAYQRFYDQISTFETASLWIPGNHDIMANMVTVVGENNPCLNKTYGTGNWHIIMLNTCVEGVIYGRLDEGELSFLDQVLEKHEEQLPRANVLVCLHHNPLPVKAAWLQQHSLKNSDDFFAILDKYSTVKCVLWGHIHHEVDTFRKGVRMLASPSTSIQFHPDNDAFTLDRKNPGYRWLDLLADGGIDTGVERVVGKDYGIDFSSSGY